MSKKKSKVQWQQFILIILFILGVVICGLLMGQYFIVILENGAAPLEFLFHGSIFIVSMYIALFMQIIIHEGGHLIGGLLSGYKFSSFRVLSFMWIKENGKIKLKKHSLAGTGGQCLMIPPELKEGKIPYKLYNLGGIIMNIIASLVALGLYMLLPKVNLISILLLMFSVIGIILAIMNGVPMSTLNNDGDNALSLGKNSSALRSFWVQFKVNELSSKGMRLKDMSKEFFLLPSEDEMNNSMVAAMGVLACNRLIDEHKFEEAEKLIHRLLEIDTSMAGIHRNLMICDEIYCKAILGSNKEEIDSLLDKEQKKFMKAMKKSISVVRTEYVYSLLIEKDREKAEKIKNKFKKISTTYPYESDVESEYELIAIADKKVYE